MELWTTSTEEEMFFLAIFLLMIGTFVWGMLLTAKALDKKQISISSIIYPVTIIVCIVASFNGFYGLLIYASCSPFLFVAFLIDTILRLDKRTEKKLCNPTNQL